MPHLYVEYSANLQPALPEAALLEQLNHAVCSHPTITDEADVKSRIRADQTYRIGLDSTGRAYVHVELRLMAGRSAEVKKALSDAIAQVLRTAVPEVPGLEIQLSADIVDMDKGSYFKGKR